MTTLFGSTIRETAAAFKTPAFGVQPGATTEDRNKAIGRIIVTILMIFLSVYLYATGKDSAAGPIVGAIVGYWIK